MFVLTLYKCMANLRLGVRGRMPIIELFLRDGILWFVAVLGQLQNLWVQNINLTAVIVFMSTTTFNCAFGRQSLSQLTHAYVYFCTKAALTHCKRTADPLLCKPVFDLVHVVLMLSQSILSTVHARFAQYRACVAQA
jgi:hypothetical protein